MHPPLDLLPSQPAADDLQTEVFRRDHPQFPARPPALRVVPPPMGEATTLLGGVDPPPQDLSLATEVLPGMGGDHLPPPRLATSPSSAQPPPTPTPTPTPTRPSIAHHPKFLIVLTILVALTTATSVALAILIIRDRARLLPPPPTATAIVVDRADRLLRPLLDHLHAHPPAIAP